MGIFSELVAADPGPEPRPCKLARFLVSLDDDDQREFARVVADPNWTNERIHQHLGGAGWGGSVSSLDRHVSGRCGCG